MRILAIRGCNLASLAGEFEIDLARGPLGDAGVFAIVGNTGAGKSTLLDALCVALFDRTPRLTNHSRVVVGRGDSDPSSLGAQDVRTLLRRGAAQGWAEVDFESRDAQRFRARWSVRRARGNTDGTIQSQQISLTAIDGGQRLGGTKTETLEAIHARLGLSFDQFRRSALLAQGEFAAFLRADGKDRSELLERMTGTEIYSRLSIQAHVKAALAEQQLRDGRAKADAIPILSDDARLQANQELESAEAAKKHARAQLAIAETAHRWVVEANKRAAELATAQQELAVARGAISSAEPIRVELSLRRRAEPLRAAWDELLRIDRQLAVARADATSIREAVVAAETREQAISCQRIELERLLSPIRDARVAANIVEQASSEHGAEARGVAAQPDAVWLREHHRLGAEIAGWPELDAKFGRCAEQAVAVRAIDREVAAVTSARANLVKAREQTTIDRQQLAARLADAQRKAESFHHRRGITLDAASRQEDGARARLAELDELVEVVARARDACSQCADVDRQLAELDLNREIDQEQLATLEQRRGTAVAVREERIRVVDQLRRAAGYEHARAELIDGEPCPLCGAADHPWKHRGAFSEVIRDQTAALRAIEAEIDEVTTAMAALAASLEHGSLTKQRLVATRVAAEQIQASASTTWVERLAALGELSLVRDPGQPDAEILAGELRAAAMARLEEARAARSQAEAATKAASEAQAQIQLCRADAEQLEGRTRDLERQLGDHDATLGRLRGERLGRIDRQRELEHDLATAVARWIEAVPESTRPRAASAQRSAIEDASFEAHQSWMAELVSQWRICAARIALADGSLVALLASIDRLARDAERTLVEHRARLADNDHRTTELSTNRAAHAADLERACDALGFQRTELERLFGVDAGRIEVLIDTLGELDRKVAQALAVVAERSRLDDEHQAVRPAGASEPEALTEQMKSLAVAAAEAENQVARLAAALTADADARKRRAAAVELLAVAERAAHIDRVLGDVIGSHDGKLFRSFAQSLTLDGLLSVANAHLEELAPRYQLERVPRHDLELQVIDRDLGSDVRSVQSLSGGESFLVSLALALGLSSMSAHDVRVRTLLIDEGFGTLDPQALETALAVLDALKAGGRQVGVISHVPQLVERVGAHVHVVQRGAGRSEVVVA
ncbi:MAG: AAA family ATPase [Kofleriaceae bacterium]